MTPPVLSPPPTPPGPVLAAGVLALISATIPAVAVLVVVLSFGRDVEPAGWLSLLLPLGMSASLAAGATLLLLGRSWLALAVPAAALTVVGLAAYFLGGAVGGFVVFSILVGLSTAVLATRPDVRRWVAASRRIRSALPAGAAS